MAKRKATQKALKTDLLKASYSNSTGLHFAQPHVCPFILLSFYSKPRHKNDKGKPANGLIKTVANPFHLSRVQMKRFKKENLFLVNQLQKGAPQW